MFLLCLNLWNNRRKAEFRFSSRMCEKWEYFISWSRSYEKQANLLTFYFELEAAAQEGIRRENNNTTKSSVRNKQGSCGGTSFPAAVYRCVGKGKPVGERLCFRRTLWSRSVPPTFFPVLLASSENSSHENCIAKNREGKASACEEGWRLPGTAVTSPVFWKKTSLGSPSQIVQVDFVSF